MNPRSVNTNLPSTASRRVTARREFGDFQTPDALATDICDVLRCIRSDFAGIVEPTCGMGSLLFAAINAFTDASNAKGYDVQSSYVAHAKSRLIVADHSPELTCNFQQADFFEVDWSKELAPMPEPLLVIGNPPWVTNAELGRLDSANLPAKLNTAKLSGIEAITGKSNFDICEAVIRKLIEAVSHRDAMLAMLCKKSVARRILQYCWQQAVPIQAPKILSIDARRHFGASVDACLFVLEFCNLGMFQTKEVSERSCGVYRSLAAKQPSTMIGWRNDQLISDVVGFDRNSYLLGSPPIRWRSGIKHDCTRVMELRLIDGEYINGFDEKVDLESDYLFPMLKGSQIGIPGETDRFMIVTQKTVGQSTDLIEVNAPKTWRYLNRFRSLLDGRRSRIYRNKPVFSVFGVGPYSFTPFKVAISSLHRNPKFHVVASQDAKPVMLDDTSYFLPLDSVEQATQICRIMNSPPVQSYLSSLAFDDSKRTVTASMLNRCDYSNAMEYSEAR